MNRGALALAVAAGWAGALACSGGGTRPARGPAPTAAEAPDAGDGATGLEPDPGGRDEAPEDERIAAIEKAMNDLAPVASQCWAAGAADDFHLAGDVKFLIVVGPKAGAGATISVAQDTTGDRVLVDCMTAVLGAYGWAPPLHGEAVELPFHFTAPAMQNVIDRRFVPHQAQAGVDVAVLLDLLSTGNPAASLYEVTIAAGTQSGPRETERPEVWMFLGAGTIEPAGGAREAVAAGDVLVAPVGVRLIVAAGDAPLTAAVALVPGGREGVARAGALPGHATTMDVIARPVQPTLVHAAKARRYPRTGGATTILVEPPRLKGLVSVGRLEIDGGVTVARHTHTKETEVLYVLSGGGTLTVGGVDVPVTEHSVIQIPAGVEHGFTASAATTALQLYTPAGPEQRFKTMK